MHGKLNVNKLTFVKVKCKHKDNECGSHKQLCMRVCECNEQSEVHVVTVYKRSNITRETLG